MPQQLAATPTSVSGRRPVGGDEATGSTSQTDVVEKQHNSEYMLGITVNMAGSLCG